MSKYLRIYNTADNVPRISLEKLGLSSKRDNPETIGRFGSGIKFAPISALRNGWEWTFTGSDSHGDYTLNYIIKNEDGIDCVWYDYDGIQKPSSFTIDAGSLSWTDSFQIYREAVSNAMDGAKDFNGIWGIDLADSIFNQPGYFNVFITASPELMNIYNNHNRYFCNNRKAVVSLGSAKAVEKIDNVARIYCHDVLVYSDEEKSSIFDYCFNTIELNEERTVKSMYSLKILVENFIAYTRSEEIITSVIDKVLSADNLIEFNDGMYKYISKGSMSPKWAEKFLSKYGENAVIVDSTMQKMNVSSVLKMNGLRPVPIRNDSAFALLKAAGIPDATDSIGESVQYDIDDDISEYYKLSQAVSLARMAEPGLDVYIDDLAVFNSKEEAILGVTINMGKNAENRRILISKDHAMGASIPDLISTVIHEYDHASTGCRDSFDTEGLKFRDLADKRIGRMIYENYRQCPVEIYNGMLICRPSNIESIGYPLKYSYEYSEFLSAYLVKTKNLNLIVYSDSGYGSRENAVLTMSENAEYFVFEDISDPKEIKVG